MTAKNALFRVWRARVQIYSENQEPIAEPFNGPYFRCFSFSLVSRVGRGLVAIFILRALISISWWKKIISGLYECKHYSSKKNQVENGTFYCKWNISTYPHKGKKVNKNSRRGDRSRAWNSSCTPTWTATSALIQCATSTLTLFYFLSLRIFQAVIGYLSIEVFSFCRIDFYLKKGVFHDFYLPRNKIQRFTRFYWRFFTIKHGFAAGQ